MDLELQKAGIWKRFSAWLCDTVIFILAALILAIAFMSLFGYGDHYQAMRDAYDKYEKEYNVDFDISQEEYDALSDEMKEKYKEANKAMNTDEEAIKAYIMVRNLMPMILSLSIVIPSLIFDFVIPMIFKNGRTVGKKIFGIAVVRTNLVKITGPCLFIRSILGKCTIETLVPLFIVVLILNGQLGSVGLIVLALILILEVVMIIITKTNSAIHDLLADTVVVDFASQRIFDSEEALVEYKKQVYAKRAQESYY